MQMPIDQFAISGRVISCCPHGDGHINETYYAACEAGAGYILQKINTAVFRDPAALMENVAAVTEYMARRTADPRRCLHLIPTRDGRSFYTAPAGGCWRVYAFVPGSLCLQSAETPELFYESGVAFGAFQRALADFPAQTLHETIPNFHNTPDRYRQLHLALAADVRGRAGECREEIDFALAREPEASALVDALARGELPLRVTHNDTKLNNVLIDAKTRRALCVIDLDTVMPGLSAYDFGDSIRFGASTAAEDEHELSKVALSLPLYETYICGFLAGCAGQLTDGEIRALPLGAKLMTLECGVRFLTDYLNGDIYFRIHREKHNLDRCRTQLRLVRDMEGKWEQMRAIAEGFCRIH